MIEALGFRATFGIVPGYHHDNDVKRATRSPSHRVAKMWQNVMAAESGPPISAVITDTLTVYGPANGCPLGGEVTVTITGSSNPVFDKDLEAYRVAVRRMIKSMKALLQQTTVRLEFYNLEVEYFKD